MVDMLHIIKLFLVHCNENIPLLEICHGFPVIQQVITHSQLIQLIPEWSRFVFNQTTNVRTQLDNSPHIHHLPAILKLQASLWSKMWAPLIRIYLRSSKFYVNVWYQKIEWWTAYITGKLTSECTQNVYIEIVLLPLWILLSERGCASQVTFTFTIIIERNTKQHAHSMYTHSLEEIHPRTSVVCMPLPCWLVQWSGSLCGVVLNSRDDLWLVSSHHCCTGGCGRRRWDVNKERARRGRGVG